MTQHTPTLVRRAVTGDERAWEQLVTQYGGLLRAIARDFRLNHEQGADAAQNTWMRLIENIRKVREPEKLGGWLACTMRRECIRLVNRQRGEQLTDDWTTGDYGLTDGPDDEVLLAERDVLLWDAVDRLPARQRQILLALSADPPQSYEQISVSLSVAVGSIGPIRQRALRRLRDLLHQSGVVDCPSYRLVLTGAREASTC